MEILFSVQGDWILREDVQVDGPIVEARDVRTSRQRKRL